MFQLVTPNGNFDSDTDQVNVVGTAQTVLLDDYLEDDILETIEIDVNDNSGSGVSTISAVEAVFEYCGYQGVNGEYGFCTLALFHKTKHRHSVQSDL